MATRVRSMYRGGGGNFNRYFIGATSVVGQLMMEDGVQTTSSEVIPCVAGTGSIDVIGVCTEAVTYSTTQADFDGFPGHKQSGEEGTVGITCDPLQIIALRVSGTSTAGTALTATAPAQILTNTTASAGGTLVTAAEVGTITMRSGLIMGRTGNNAGIARVISAHSDNVSTTVVVPFPNAIAVGDTFLRVLASKKVLAIDLTTDFVEMNGASEEAVAAGEWNVYDVDFDIINDEILVYVVPRSHFFNALA